MPHPATDGLAAQTWESQQAKSQHSVGVGMRRQLGHSRSGLFLRSFVGLWVGAPETCSDLFWGFSQISPISFLPDPNLASAGRLRTNLAGCWPCLVPILTTSGHSTTIRKLGQSWGNFHRSQASLAKLGPISSPARTNFGWRIWSTPAQAWRNSAHIRSSPVEFSKQALLDISRGTRRLRFSYPDRPCACIGSRHDATLQRGAPRAWGPPMGRSHPGCRTEMLWRDMAQIRDLWRVAEFVCMQRVLRGSIDMICATDHLRSSITSFSCASVRL